MLVTDRLLRRAARQETNVPRRPRRISPVRLVWICGIALGLLAGGVVAYGVISVSA